MSGLATPVITYSAQADFVCVVAISIAVAKGDDKGGFGMNGSADASLQFLPLSMTDSTLDCN